LVDIQKSTIFSLLKDINLLMLLTGPITLA